MHGKKTNLLIEIQSRIVNDILDNNLGIFKCDVEGNCIFVDSHWIKITGVDMESALGKGWLNFVHNEDREKLEESWNEYISNVSQCKAKIECFRFVRSDNKSIKVKGRAEPVFIEEEFVGFIGAIIEITKDTEILDSLHRLKEQISQEKSLTF